MEDHVRGYVVRDGRGEVVVILTGHDAADAAAWYAEDGFEVREADLGHELAAA